MSARMPLYRQTQGFVYILRNPLDVMVSFFNFNMLRFLRGELTPERLEAVRTDYVNTFIRHCGNPVRGKGSGHTNWNQNVRTWLAGSRVFPSVVIRYEDLLADTEKEVKRLLAFFRWDISEDALKQAIRKSSFTSMKELEEREIGERKNGFFYRRDLAKAHGVGIRFMNKGVANQGYRYLTDEQKAGFMNAFGATMRDLGYRIEPDSGAILVGDHPQAEIRPLDIAPVLGRAMVQQGVARNGFGAPGAATRQESE